MLWGLAEGARELQDALQGCEVPRDPAMGNEGGRVEGHRVDEGKKRTAEGEGERR